MIDRFSRWLTHHTKLILVIAFLLLIPSAIGYLNTYVNYDILSYLPDDLDSVKGQQVLDETFHNSASTVLIVENMPAKDVAALKEKVSKVEECIRSPGSMIFSTSACRRISFRMKLKTFFTAKKQTPP